MCAPKTEPALATNSPNYLTVSFYHNPKNPSSQLGHSFAMILWFSTHIYSLSKLSAASGQ